MTLEETLRYAFIDEDPQAVLAVFQGFYNEIRTVKDTSKKYSPKLAILSGAISCDENDGMRNILLQLSDFETNLFTLYNRYSLSESLEAIMMTIQQEEPVLIIIKDVEHFAYRWKQQRLLYALSELGNHFKRYCLIGTTREFTGFDKLRNVFDLDSKGRFLFPRKLKRAQKMMR